MSSAHGGSVVATKPTLFFSHSSRDPDLTRQLADELGRLDSLELLLDEERLQPGYQWEPALHEYLARCDAGLLLLTKEVLRRPDYVRKEATVLAWRAALDPGFPFFIAADPSIRDPGESDEQDGRDDTSDGDRLPTLDEAGFGPLGLGRVHWLGTTDAGEIADEVGSLMAEHVIADTPFDRVVRLLRDLLERAGREAVRSVAARLDVDDGPRRWNPATDELRRDAESIARHLLTGTMGPYGLGEGTPSITPSGLSALAGHLKLGTTHEDLLKILTLVAPHWVHGDMAGLFALLPARQPRRALAINGRHVPDYTAKMFLWRGHLHEAPNYSFLDVAGGNSGSLLKHYTRQICDAFCAWQDLDPRPDRDETIAIMRTRFVPTMHVVLVPPFPHGRDLDVLLDRFPTVNIVLAISESADLPTGSSRIDVSEPAVDAEVEDRAYWDFRKARATANQNGW